MGASTLVRNFIVVSSGMVKISRVDGVDVAHGISVPWVLSQAKIYLRYALVTSQSL